MPNIDQKTQHFERKTKDTKLQSLKIFERLPSSCVKMKAEDGKLPFTLSCTLESVNKTQCIAQFHFEAELNPMMKTMLTKPLGNFLNLLSEKLKEIKS